MSIVIWIHIVQYSPSFKFLELGFLDEFHAGICEKTYYLDINSIISDAVNLRNV